MNTNSVVIVSLIVLVVALAILGCVQRSASEGTANADAVSFNAAVFDDAGALSDPAPIAKVVKTDAQWRAQLTPAQYRIVRQAGTERPFTGALLKNKAEGVYTCVACGLPLFDSHAKFESGTGWPSWYEPIAAPNVAERTDGGLGMQRTEILCARCDGHLGHVFDDGPRPTGLRYCVNSESVAFTPAAELAKLAETPATRPAETRPAATSRPAEAAPLNPAVNDPSLKKVVFAGGCFWCVEAVFEELDGVREVISGYAGGTKETANYQAVCSGKTGHAEAVQIIYDPAKISYEDLLRVHVATHDPTQLNRQGNDVGPQYRSAIFYADDREQALARAFIDGLNEQKGVFSRKVVTTVEPLTVFYPAEGYHQNYVCNNPTDGYVRAVALPKVAKVRKEFRDRLKAKSPLDK